MSKVVHHVDRKYIGTPAIFAATDCGLKRGDYDTKWRGVSCPDCLAKKPKKKRAKV